MATVTPYNPQESKRDQVKRMFDKIAFKYDFLNHLLSFGVDTGWRKKVVRKVASDNPVKILDVATGTGDLAIMLASTNPAATVTGADLSSEMLEIGREKVIRKNVQNIDSMVEADVEALPFADAEFDTVTAAFGVRNFQNIEAGLAEMNRVLKSGGHIYVLEFAMPDNKLFGTLFTFYFRQLLPFIGGVFSGEYKAYRYLQKSVEAFPSGDKFAEILGRVGFSQVEQTKLTYGLAIIYRAIKADN